MHRLTLKPYYNLKTRFAEKYSERGLLSQNCLLLLKVRGSMIHRLRWPDRDVTHIIIRGQCGRRTSQTCPPKPSFTHGAALHNSSGSKHFRFQFLYYLITQPKTYLIQRPSMYHNTHFVESIYTLNEVLITICIAIITS